MAHRSCHNVIIDGLHGPRRIPGCTLLDLCSPEEGSRGHAAAPTYFQKLTYHIASTACEHALWDSSKLSLVVRAYMYWTLAGPSEGHVSMSLEM